VESDDLLQGFVRGDRQAIATVATLVRRVVSDRGYWIPHDERDDVVQEAVVRVYQAVSSSAVRVERDFEGYVRTAAHHGCVDWIRRHRPSGPIDPQTANPAPGPDGLLAARERLDRGRRILRLLGASCLRLIRLRVRDRLSHREIAERLGRTEGGVRNQLYKCLERARAIAGSED
jgi:RNA polymerase sigma-70 factor (ECF subfamily)